MADSLQTLVQRMLDAGESEDQIAAVIKAYKPTAPTAVSASEPDTYWGGFAKGAGEGMYRGAKGYVKGLIPGVISGVEGAITLPLTVVKDALGFLGDTVDIARSDNPGQAAIDKLTAAATALKEKGQAIPGAITDALSLAATDPEAFGTISGELVGNVVGGAAVTGGARLLPKPVARAMGSTIKQLGGSTGFALRIAGAHQVLGGNPMGFATMLAPGYLGKTGRALERYGTEAGALAETPMGRLGQLKEDLATGKAPATLLQRADEMQADLVTRRPLAKLEEDHVTLDKEQMRLSAVRREIQKAADAAQAATDEAANKATIEAGQKGRTPVTKITKTIKAPTDEGGVQAQTTTYVEPDTATGGMDPRVAQLMKVNRGMSQQVAEAAVAQLDKGAAPAMSPWPRAIAPMTPAPVATPALPTAADIVNGATRAEAAKPENVAAVQALRTRVATAANRVIPPSQTSRAMSAVPGLSAQDYDILQELVPGVRPEQIKALRPDVLKEFLTRRAARGAGYASDAALSTRFQQLIDDTTK